MGISKEIIIGKLVEISAKSENFFITEEDVKLVKLDEAQLKLKIVLGYPARRVLGHIRTEIENGLAVYSEIEDIELDIDSDIHSHSVQRNLSLMPEIKNVIAVASGKGGVGKSTTAVNLALALASEGANVGVLDADIYGPSQHMMLGAQGQPDSPDGKTVEPIKRHGIQMISIGLLVKNDTPMVWRGPMVTGALEQLLRDTNWKALDYLIVDLPPGTGDIQLTLAQKVPLTGAVIVTTPQDIALIDARKGLKMFEKVGVPILGIVENMSFHICSNCGNEETIFGSGGAREMCKDYGVDLLGQLPLDKKIREQTDSGVPTVIADRDSQAGIEYQSIAIKTGIKISALVRQRKSKIPKIVVQNT